MKLDSFTSHMESSFIESQTQLKKIAFLEKELLFAEKYGDQLDKIIVTHNQTIHKLSQNRPNYEIFANYFKTVCKLQECLKIIRNQLRQCNAKLLIEMQLRTEEKSTYYQKLNELENLIKEMRKQMMDKEEGFTMVVNRLRMYENMREVILQNKLGKDLEKSSKIKPEDKDQLIQALTEECEKYRVYCEKLKPDVDKKLQILRFALNSNLNYETLKKSYFQKLEVAKEKKKEQIREKFLTTSVRGNKYSSVDKIHKQLVKQLKKELLSNKLLENALNEAVEKNQEIFSDNQSLRKSNAILTKKNSILTQKLQQYKRSQKGVKENIKIQDDYEPLMKPPVLNEKVKDEKERQKYIKKIRSKNYKVNIQEIEDDVEKIGEFMVLYVAEQPQQMIKCYSWAELTEEMDSEFGSVMSEIDIEIEEI